MAKGGKTKRKIKRTKRRRTKRNNPMRTKSKWANRTKSKKYARSRVKVKIKRSRKSYEKVQVAPSGRINSSTSSSKSYASASSASSFSDDSPRSVTTEKIAPQPSSTPVPTSTDATDEEEDSRIREQSHQELQQSISEQILTTTEHDREEEKEEEVATASTSTTQSPKATPDTEVVTSEEPLPAEAVSSGQASGQTASEQQPSEGKECKPAGNGSDESLESAEEAPELPEPVRQYLAQESFTLVRYIAASTTCVVFQVLNRAGLYRAAKVIDHLKLPELIRDEHLPQELKIIRMVQHANIVRTDAVLTALPNYSIIIGELAEDGDLITYLEKHEEDLPGLGQCRKWFHQTTNALHYLHQQYIAHRDIKLDNILLCHGLVAKLADFGFATFCRNSTSGERILCDTFCGTTEYQAPETLLCEEPYDGMIADCFSLGVVLHVLLTRKFPFGSGEEVQTPEGLTALQARIRAKERTVKAEVIEKNVTLRSLLKQLLNPDMEERIRVAQALEHPWLANANDSDQ